MTSAALWHRRAWTRGGRSTAPCRNSCRRRARTSPRRSACGDPGRGAVKEGALSSDRRTNQPAGSASPPYKSLTLCLSPAVCSLTIAEMSCLHETSLPPPSIQVVVKLHLRCAPPECEKKKKCYEPPTLGTRREFDNTVSILSKPDVCLNHALALKGQCAAVGCERRNKSSPLLTRK